MEKNLISLLEAIKDLQIRTADGYLSYHNAVNSLESEYSRLDQWKKELLNKDKQDFKEYFAARSSFFDNYSKFLSGDFDKEIHSLFAKIKEQSGSNQYDDIDAYVTELFKNAKEEYKNYSEHINYINGFCKNAFAIIGYSGVGTSDLGVNPFWKSYPNVGTHANIYNTIMNEDFIRPLPKWVSIILAFVIAIFTAFMMKKIERGFIKVLLGIVLLSLTLSIGILLFVFGKIYLQLFLPVITVVISFIVILLLNFIFSEKEKGFLSMNFLIVI